MMEFIKYTKVVKYNKYGIFRCSFCGNKKEIMECNAKKTKSCGCVAKHLYIESRMKNSENSKVVIDFGEYIKFSLTNGGYTIIDKSDYSNIKGYSWYKSIRGYAEARINNKLVKLHRLVMGSNGGKIIDHINRDPLDNRKENLRYCTQGENIKNSGPRKGKYKGVHKNIQGKYVAQCQHNHIGTFDNEKEAGIAYNKKAKELFGEFAFLNTIN